MPRQFSLEFRQSALRILKEAPPEPEPETKTEWATIRHAGENSPSDLRRCGSGVDDTRSARVRVRVSVPKITRRSDA